MTDIGRLVDSTQSLTDLELRAYLASLTPAEQTAVITSNNNAAVTNSAANKSANFT